MRKYNWGKKKAQSRSIFRAARRFGGGRRRRTRGKSILPRGKRSKSAKLYTVSNRLGSLWPDVLYVKLKYSDVYAISLAANAAPALQVYSVNNLADPDFTSAVSHRPYGFDEYSRMYNYYYTLGSSISLRCTVGEAENEQKGAIRVYLLPASQTTSIAITTQNNSNLQEVPRCKSATGTFYGKNPFYLKHYTKIGTVLGLKGKTTDSHSEYSGVCLPAGPPTIQAYWQILAHIVDPAAVASELLVEVLITYYVRFFHRTMPPYSRTT